MTGKLLKGFRAWLVAFVLVPALLVGCGSSAPATTSPSTTPGAANGSAPAGQTATQGQFFNSSVVHDVAISFEQAAYDAMIDEYTSTGDKAWIEATVTVDGTVYQRAGIRLKGNSSLRALGGGFPGPGGQGGGGQVPGGTGDVSAENPEALPWLVTLDRFVDGQSHEGITEFVVRSNSSETALNEAVALELLERAGLASQDAIAVRFRVNGGKPVLRLVIEHPDDRWVAERFDATGALYKAESTGDYSDRGDDPEAYDEVFDQEAGQANADLTPLIDFLDFINNADDATFAAEIAAHLDVDAFATYLAMQELLNNFDDIDGPGNNSYLYYDPATDRFTVVPWDYNLAFGAMGGGMGGGFGGNGGGGLRPQPSGSFQPPAGGFQPPAGGSFQPPAGGGQGGFGGAGGPGGRSNILVERFLAIPEYEGLVEKRQTELTAQLFDSGVAADVLAEWVALLEGQATDLVDAATITSEAERIASSF